MGRLPIHLLQNSSTSILALSGVLVGDMNIVSTQFHCPFVVHVKLLCQNESSADSEIPSFGRPALSATRQPFYQPPQDFQFRSLVHEVQGLQKANVLLEKDNAALEAKFTTLL